MPICARNTLSDAHGTPCSRSPAGAPSNQRNARMPRQCRQSSHGRDKPPELRTRAAAGHCLDRKKTTRPDANRIWTGQAFLRGGAVGWRSIRSGRRKGAVLVRNRRKWPLGSRAAVRWGAAAVVAPFPSVEARTVGRMDHGAPRFPLICKILLQTAASMMGPGHEMRGRQWSRTLRCHRRRSPRQIGYLDRKPLPSRARQGRGETLAPWSYTPPGGYSLLRAVRQPLAGQPAHREGLARESVRNPRPEIGIGAGFIR